MGNIYQPTKETNSALLNALSLPDTGVSSDQLVIVRNVAGVFTPYKQTRQLLVNSASFLYPKISLALRPVLGAYGDSIALQDRPASLFGDPSGVSPAFWLNALLLNAFDLLDTTKIQTITPTGGTQTNPVDYQCGIWGYSGGQLRQALRYSIDQYIARLTADAPGRTCYVLQSGGLNDLANDNTLGADSSIFDAWREIIQKQIDAGIVPVCKTNEPTSSISTNNERRNAAALRDRIRSYCAANGLPVIDVGELIQEFARGADLQYLTRGVVGDRTHPNQIYAQILGIGYQRVLSPIVNPTPKYVRPDFNGVLLTPNPFLFGTAGTRGANADAGAIVPDNWTLSATGTLTTANSSKTDYNVGGDNAFIQMISTGVSTGGGSGLTSSAPVPALNTAALHQLIADYTITETISGDHTVQYRRDGGNFTNVPNTSSNDTRSTAVAAGRPDGWSLMVGRRLVVASFPSTLPAASQRTIWRLGGGNGIVGAGSSAKCYAAFASLIQYGNPAPGYVP